MSEVKFFNGTHLVALGSHSGKSISNVVKRNGVNVYFFEGEIDTSRGDTLDSLSITQRFNNNGYIGWGDGTVELITSPEFTTTHNYASGGIYRVKITGNVAWNASTGSTGAQKWIDLIRLDSLLPNSAGNGAFQGAGFTTWTLLRNQQKGQGTGINNYFSSNTSFVSGLLNGMDIDGTSISCTALIQGCTIYNEDLGQWNLKPTALSNAFSGALAFNHDLSNWDTSSCTGMGACFNSANSFNNGGVNMSAWDTSLVTSMESMFQGNTAFNDGGTPGVSNGGVGVGMDTWDVGNVFNFRRMFQQATNFNTYIGSWDVSSLTDGFSTFFRSAFNQDLSNWNFDRTRSRGASTSTAVNKLIDSGANFVTDGVANDYYVVNLSDNSQPRARVTAVATTELTLDTDIFTASSQRYVVWSSYFGLQSHFSDCPFNAGLASGVAGTRIGNWDMTGLSSMQNIFQSNTAFNQDISTWNLATCIDISGAFYRASSFNYDLTNWERSTVGDESTMCRVTNMTNAFRQTSFNSGLAAGVTGTRMSNWDLRSNTSLFFTFTTNSGFNQNIGAWDVSNVTTMRGTFQEASQFNCGAASGVSSTNIGSWNTVKVESFQDTFRDNNAFNNDISTWNVSAADTLNAMFYQASAIDQNFGTWQFKTGANASSWHYSSGISDANVALCLIGWDAVVGQGEAVSMISWCSSGAGPRTLAIATYPSAKTAYDNLIAPVGSGGKGWDMTGAITWV
jgi:hypothetical protein